MKYIAYGSNMSREQMAHRCPGAKLIGTGFLRGYQLEFNRHATVIKTKNKKDAVPVAIWEITPEHERKLDLYESCPIYYGKSECKVTISNGSQIKGLIYIMQYFLPRPPHKQYYEGIRDAYLDLGLEAHIDQFLLPALKRSER